MENASTTGEKFGAALKTIGANIGISLTVSLAISVIDKLINSFDNMVSKAQEATSVYMSSQQTLSDYKSEIEQLQETMNSETSSYQEVCDARERLLEIQSDLISNYGNEASGIDLVNESLQEQSDIFDQMDKKSRQTWENEVNEASDAATIINGLWRSSKMAALSLVNPLEGFTGNKDFYEDIFVNQMSFTDALKKWANDSDVYTSIMGSNLDSIKDKYENFSVSFKKSGNDTIDSFIKSLEGVQQDDNEFIITGNVDDVYDKIVLIQSFMEGLDGYTFRTSYKDCSS